MGGGGAKGGGGRGGRVGGTVCLLARPGAQGVGTVTQLQKNGESPTGGGGGGGGGGGDKVSRKAQGVLTVAQLQQNGESLKPSWPSGKMSASSGSPVYDTRFCRGCVCRSADTSDSGALGATLISAWRYRVSVRSGWPGVCIL